MAERTFFQSLAHAVGDFFQFTAELLGRDDRRNALIRDLGGDPSRVSSVRDLPADKLAAINTYRDSVSNDLEADAQLVLDIAAVFDAIMGNIEVWAEAFPELDNATSEAIEDIVDELAIGLLDLAASSWIRFRVPWLFLLMEALAAIDEAASTYGPADGVGGRFWRSVRVLVEFLLQPGKTFPALDLGRGETDGGGVAVDAIFRLGGAFVGFWDGKKGIDGIADTYVGWDSPALSIESSDKATTADLVSSHMVSVALGKDATPADAEVPDAGGIRQRESLQVTFMYVPTGAPGGPAVFVALGGALSLDEKLSDKWLLAGRLRSDAGFAVLIRSDRRPVFSAGVEDLHQSVALSTIPGASSAISFSVPRPDRTRLDIGQLSFTFDLGIEGVTVTGSMLQSVFVLDRSDFDSFLKRLLPKDPVRLPFSVTVGVSGERGLFIDGSVLPSPGTAGPGVRNSPLAGDNGLDTPMLSATLPLGKRLGPVTIHEIALKLSRGRPDAPGGSDVIAAEADVSFSAQLGPVYFRLDQVGLALVVDNSLPRSDRNLHFLDARLAASAPLAISVSVDTEIFNGGGTLFHDPRTGTYFGVFAIRLWERVTLKAIGLIATRNPDGTPGSSFIVIATVEGLGWQVGPVTFDGLGVLYASERTFDETAVRAALPTGQLRHLLFPADPVHHAPEILAPLSTFFPALRDSYLVGVLVKMVFGRPPRVRLDLALIYQWGDAVSNRLIVLGRVSSILPDDRVRAVQINLDAVGIFDPSEGLAALDAVLVDSKLCGRFPLTGSAAMRRVRGPGGFALAVGGFHPDFPIPQGFPSLQRITVALTAGDNPKLICQAYLAITSNTVQFGANASLYAAACGFSIEGSVGFDVLIQIYPPHFLAEFRAKVQLKRGSRNLFSVSVQAEVEGPLPLRISGKASFEILWCDFSVHFDKTLVGGSGQPVLPAVNAVAELVQSLADPNNWEVDAPPAAQRMVAVRRDDRAGVVLMHPMATLTVRQGVVPLNLGRDVDRVGGSVPSGARRFAVTGAVLGAVPQPIDNVREMFAPGQYFDLTDDEALAAPSFEEMDAGVSFGGGGYSFPMGAKVDAPFDYTDITIGADGKPVPESQPHRLDGPLALALIAFGAAALSPVRAEASSRFRSGPDPDAPAVRPRGWAVAEPASTAPPGPLLTWVEASQQVSKTSTKVLVQSAGVR